jgi:hypothetical protein
MTATDAKPLSVGDTQKLISKRKHFGHFLWVVLLGTIAFYGIVLSASSIQMGTDLHAVFAAFCILFALIGCGFIFIELNRIKSDLAGGIKRKVRGKVTSKYSKRTEDYYGSFVLNGKRYYAEGESFKRIEPGSYIDIEIAPHSRLLLAIH